MPKSLPKSRLLTDAQVVERLHDSGLVDLTAKWVQRQADNGVLPYALVANKRRFREDIIDQLIQDWCDSAV